MGMTQVSGPNANDWGIPPAVFDYLKTLRGHITALRAMKDLVDALKNKIDYTIRSDTIQEQFPAWVDQITAIRRHLDEHVRRFMLDFSQPEEPPVEEALDMVLRGIKQYPDLDYIDLAWKLRLTPTITRKAVRRLRHEGKTHYNYGLPPRGRVRKGG